MQSWKKQLRQKLSVTTGNILLGTMFVLPAAGLGAGTAQAQVVSEQPNILVNNVTHETNETSFDDSANKSAIEVRGANGSLTFSGTNIESHTAVGTIKKYAVYANTGGAITIDGDLNASTTTQQSHAVTSTGTGSEITLNNATLQTAGVYAFGINATGGGTVTTNGTLVIRTQGDLANGIYVNSNSTYVANGSVDIVTQAGGASGVALSGGTAQLGVAKIQTMGEGASGLNVANGGQLTVDEVDISTAGGADSLGVLVSDAGSKVTLGGGIIENTAASPTSYQYSGSTGLRARNEGELEVTGDITLNTNAVGSEGARVTGGGLITLNNTEIHTQQAISSGISIGRLVHPWEPGSGLPNSKVISNGTLNIQVDDSTSAGILLTGDGATLAAANENSSGNIHSAGSAIRFEAGADQSATLKSVTLTHDGEAGEFILPFFYYPSLHQNVINDGNLIQIGGADPIQNWLSGGIFDSVYDNVPDRVDNGQLTLIDSNATAQDSSLLMHVTSSDATNGSTFTFNNQNTVLRGGIVTDENNTLYMNLDSASQWTVTRGSNTTNLANNNSAIIFDYQANGPGYKELLTENYTGEGGSITFNTLLSGDSSPSDLLIIDGGNADGNTAVLINNTGGSGAQTTGDGIKIVDAINSGTTGNSVFYLQDGPITAGLYNYDLFRSGLQPDVETEDDWFLRSETRDETIASNVLSILGSRVGLASLSNLHERERDVKVLSQDQTARKGVWGRIFGQGNKFQSTDTDESGFDSTLWGAQAGIDLMASQDNAGGRKYAGLYVAYATSNGDALRGGEKIGDLDLDATTLGAYYTKYHKDGWYLDLVGQYSWLNGIKIETETEMLKPGGSGYALSLEAGRQFNRDSKIIREVQAQLIYQHTDIDDVTLSDASQFDISDLNAVTGRLGLRLYQNPDSGKKFLPWVRANLWHTFANNSRISSLGSTYNTPIGGTTGELQVGFTAGPHDKGDWNFYGGAGYQWSLAGAKYSGWKGQIGFRKGW